MAGDPAETEQPQGRYPAGAFEAAEQTPPPSQDQQPPILENISDPIGKTVSHYRVLERVGGGGMGVVYRAQDLRLGRSVALKFLPEEIGHDARARERFEREARAASALDHPNICPIYEFGEHDGKPFIVMQLLRGQTLKDILATAVDPATGMVVGKALPTDQVLDLVIQVLAGLEAAHEKGLIHRDIKPANIFVTHRGVAKVLDFGLVKLLHPDGTDSDDGHEEHSTTSPVILEPAGVELSRAGVALGTAAYMSPEQIRGEALDARTDLFSVGLMMYEMATGRRAFTGENIAGLRNAIMTKTPAPVRQVNHQQPARLERIINKCIEKDPAQRYQNAAQIRSDLQKLRSLLEHPLRRRWKLAVASVVAVSGLVAGVVYHLHRQAQFKERETIVLADFNNKTGETVWDESLKQRLANYLGQSPYLNVLSEQKVDETLKLMKRPATTRVTAEIARDVCLRSNSKALLAGSITRLGGSYEIDLQATNCQTGEQLAGASAQAKRQEDVIGVLLKASDEVRRQLGESLASVQKYDTPLPPATTASLEAIQAYAWGLKVKTTQGAESALPFFKRAVELDPEFGDAYTALGAAYGDTDQSALAKQNFEKAYELRDRVTQRERFHIEADYYDSVKGELEKANQTYFNWIQVYSDDWKPHQNLAANYAELGQYDRAINEQLVALNLTPETADGMTALVGYYNAVNQPAKADATFDDARKHKLENPYLHLYRYQTGFLEGSDAVMQQEVASAAEDPAAQRMVLAAQSDTEAYHGRIEAANDFSQRAVDSARHAGQSETAAKWRAMQALREAELGNKAQAKKLAAEALSIGTGSNVNIIVALTWARIGETAQAQKLAEKIDHEFPQSTMVQNFGLPIVRAAINLQKDKSAAAIEVLQTTLPYEQGFNGPLGYLYPAYLRGEAYLRTHQPDLAAAELQKMLNHPGIVQNFITAALARLQLARAQAAMGNKVAAQKSYEDFLALWKEADDGLTILKAAKIEYQRVQ